ncbi:MAG: hypothetical protein GY832_23815 [Chloroflexi bacterium]|nr:hypothetical protein [Chloroflexota bacterium]
MSNTPVNDLQSLTDAQIALEKSQEAESHLEQARCLFIDIEQDTDAEIPDLDDIQATAVLLTDDIKDGIAAYSMGKVA